MQKPISPETASCSEGAVLNVDDPLEQDQDDDDDLYHKKYSCGVSCHVVLPQVTQEVHADVVQNCFRFYNFPYVIPRKLSQLFSKNIFIITSRS